MAVTPLLQNPHGAGARLVHPYAIQDQAGYNGTGAGGAATVITITGVTGKPIILSQVAWSFSAAPAAGCTITIADGTITRDQYAGAAAEPHVWYFDPPLSFTSGATVTVTLSAPGGAVVGKVSVVPFVQ